MTLIVRTTGIEHYMAGGEGRIKALIMGAPGSGKTRSASFWPRPIYADCEDGLMSVADRKVPYASIKSSKDMAALLKMLEAEGRKPMASRQFETLVIDTLDAYQRIVMQERLDMTGGEAFSGWQDWGYLDAKMTMLVARLNQLNMNVVVNLHVKDQKVGEDDEGKGGYFVVSPKLKGDLREQIAAEFDLVGYMGTHFAAEGGERVLKRGIQWHATLDRPILKDRSGQLPKFTPVEFSEQDYSGLLERMGAQLDKLAASETVMELDTEEESEPEVVAPLTGGPVGAKTAPVKKATAPKKATEPKPAPAPSAEAETPSPTPVGKPVASVPAAPKPVIAAAPKEPQPPMVPIEEVIEQLESEWKGDEPTTTEDAVETVTEVLGGEVISDTTEPICGSPRFEDNDEGFTPAEGCGKELKPVFTDGRVTGAVEGENADLIEIAGLRTRTLLCNSCFAAVRAATRK